MNDEWSTFLNETAPDSGLPAQPDVPAFCGLTAIGLLRVSGGDAETFLQGQSTCDIAGLEPEKSGLGAFCNPKGRVIASFRILRRNDSYYLFLPADLVETIHKRLKIYVLRSKVSIENLTPYRGFIGLFHPGTELPDISSFVQGDDVITIAIGQSARRVLIAADTQAAKRIWQALRASPDYSPVGSGAWRLRNIEEGLPSETQATSEEFLPQMLNLDILGGISYRKGCYTGQEVVARTHFLGNLKRRMFRLRTLSERQPEPGDPLYRAGEAEGQRLGQVVAAAPEAERGFQLLAVLPLDCAVDSDLRLFRPDGPAVEFLTLPYTFEVP
jgi:folate-binding protein YgfZ